MDLVEHLEALKLSSANPKDDSDGFSLLDCFKKGTGARMIFAEHIASFLTLDDLLNAATCCRQMNGMCRTYTVGEILTKQSVEMSRHHKMELGKLVMSSVVSKYNPMRPRKRYIRSAEGRFWARLYHPTQLPEIELAMCAYCYQHGIEVEMNLDEFDWEANKDAETPVLVSATFGHENHGTMDVTIIMRFLLMKQGNTRLILRNRGTHSYWYHLIFGDPCPRVTKKLWISTRNPNGDVQDHVFCEDIPFSMKLRAGRFG